MSIDYFKELRNEVYFPNLNIPKKGVEFVESVLKLVSPRKYKITLGYLVLFMRLKSQVEANIFPDSDTNRYPKIHDLSIICCESFGVHWSPTKF